MLTAGFVNFAKNLNATYRVVNLDQDPDYVKNVVMMDNGAWAFAMNVWNNYDQDGNIMFKMRLVKIMKYIID